MTTLSTLVVTNRPMFASWWTWNIQKQTRKPDEVIVICNCDDAYEELCTFADQVVDRLQGIPTNVHFMHPTTSIGEMRQEALDLAQGDFINYMDDDDWYHPWLFAEFVRGLEAGYGIVTGNGNHRLILDELNLFRFDEIIDLIHLPFCAVHRHQAQTLRFAPVSVNEDILWLEQLSTFVGKNRTGVDLQMPVMCMIHGRNTWNKRSISGYEHAIEQTGETLTETSWATSRNHMGLLEVTQEEWKETWCRLKGLQDALKELRSGESSTAP